MGLEQRAQSILVPSKEENDTTKQGPSSPVPKGPAHHPAPPPALTTWCSPPSPGSHCRSQGPLCFCGRGTPAGKGQRACPWGVLCKPAKESSCSVSCSLSLMGSTVYREMYYSTAVPKRCLTSDPEVHLGERAPWSKGKGCNLYRITLLESSVSSLRSSLTNSREHVAWISTRTLSPTSTSTQHGPTEAPGMCRVLADSEWTVSPGPPL